MSQHNRHNENIPIAACSMVITGLFSGCSDENEDGMSADDEADERVEKTAKIKVGSLPSYSIYRLYFILLPNLLVLFQCV